MQATTTISSKKNIYQFFKFVLIGILNTIIDFGLLNILIALFGLGMGSERYIVFKAISFTAAVCNSYIFNKFWVFKKNDAPSEKVTREFITFLIISIIGLILNALVGALVFSSGRLLYPSLSSQMWANIGALTGSIMVLLFNFFGYKLFVFKTN